LLTVTPNPSHPNETVRFQWTATGFHGVVTCADNMGWLQGSPGTGTLDRIAGVHYATSFRWTVTCDDGDFYASSYVDVQYIQTPPPPPPPVPPPPPPDPPLVESRHVTTEYDECENGQTISPKVPCYAPQAIRCKRYVFEWVYSEAGLYDVAGYAGAWRVCYRPYGGGITSVTYRYGDGTWSDWFWYWDGNESGYPQHVRQDHRVYFRYRAKIHLCAFGHACGPMKFPWINFTFKDTGFYGQVSYESGIS
jgi:hypothetical protein